MIDYRDQTSLVLADSLDYAKIEENLFLIKTSNYVAYPISRN
jgi:hypothetical protein